MQTNRMTVQSVMTGDEATQALTIAVQLKIFRDGDQLCIVFKNFINLQESPAYFMSSSDSGWDILDRWLRFKEDGGDVHPLYHVSLDLLKEFLAHLKEDQR